MDPATLLAAVSKVTDGAELISYRDLRTGPWVPPDRSATPPPADSTPIFVALNPESYRGAYDMKLPQMQPHVKISAATEDPQNGCKLTVSFRETTEQDAIKQIEKHFAKSDTPDDVRILLPPQWTNVPVDTEERVHLMISYFHFTPTKFLSILNEVDRVKAASAGEAPDKSAAQWHVTLVAADPTLVSDFSVGLTQPTPFPGQLSRPSTKILPYDTFAKHAHPKKTRPLEHTSDNEESESPPSGKRKKQEEKEEKEEKKEQ